MLKAELNNDKIKWAYLPYSMHMAGMNADMLCRTLTPLLGQQPLTCHSAISHPIVAARHVLALSFHNLLFLRPSSLPSTRPHPQAPARPSNT